MKSKSLSRASFGVVHFAGTIEYDVTGKLSWDLFSWSLSFVVQVHPSVASLKTSVSLNFLVEKGVADVAPPNFDQVRSQGLLVSSRSKGAGRKKSLETRSRLNYIVWRAGSELNMTENTTDNFPKPLKYSYVSCMVFSWLIPCGQSRDPSIIFHTICRGAVNRRACGNRRGFRESALHCRSSYSQPLTFFSLAAL